MIVVRLTEHHKTMAGFAHTEVVVRTEPVDHTGPADRMGLVVRIDQRTVVLEAEARACCIRPAVVRKSVARMVVANMMVAADTGFVARKVLAPEPVTSNQVYSGLTGVAIERVSLHRAVATEDKMAVVVVDSLQSKAGMEVGRP